jgi:hypothetical protein
MRNPNFIAAHRGGPLTKEHHRLLIRWAMDCSKNVLSLIDEPLDQRLVNALYVAEKWEKGNTRTGEAMKASVGAHQVARESTNPVTIAVARSIGHAVATAHMADHSLGGALYALKAINLAGKSVEEERKWQIEQLPEEIKELVLTEMSIKAKHFKI